jgi:hypothetical protein
VIAKVIPGDASYGSLNKIIQHTIR